MRFGAHLPSAGMPIDPARIVDFARTAEEHGYDSVWTSDHVVIPERWESRYPFSRDGKLTIDVETPYADALTTLSFVAAVTTRIRLGVSVLILPYRHPLDTAKRAATLDVLSGGRLILGAGLGWLREEFDAVGADFGLRAESFREQLEIMHAAWTRPTASFRGDVFAFEAVGSAPRPTRATGVEVWVGSSSRSVLRHACRHATAVHWIMEDLREIRRRVDMLDEVAREAGLQEPPQVTLRARIAVDRDPSPVTTGVLTGPVAYLVDTLGEYAGAGVTHVLIDRRAGGYDRMQASFDELAPVIGALEGA